MNTLQCEEIWQSMRENNFETEENFLSDSVLCGLCRNLMIDPCLTRCGCHYCRKCLEEFLSSGPRQCNSTRCAGTDRHLTKETDILRDVRIRLKILQTKIKCPNNFCVTIFPLEKVVEHLRNCVRLPLAGVELSAEEMTTSGHQLLSPFESLANKIDNVRNENKDLQQKYRFSQTSLESLQKDNQMKEDRITRIEAVTTGLENRIIELERNNQQIQTRPNYNSDFLRFKEILAKDMQNIKMQIPYVQRMLKTLESIVKTLQNNFSHTLLFRINEFESKKSSDKIVTSEAFNSSVNGYSLRLEFIPGGKGNGRGTHMSVFAGINKGVHDDMLSWPFKYSFNISLINQSNGRVHLTKTFKHAMTEERLKLLYNKPIKERNTGIGNNTFISHDVLQRTTGLVVNDSVLFTCSIGPP